MQRKLNRREVLGASVSAAAVGLVGRPTASLAGDIGQSTEKEFAGSEMKLSLSVRVAETPGTKDKSTMTMRELITLAKSHGYEALCLRASQAGIHTPPKTVKRMIREIREAGLVVSMVTGDLAVPRNNNHGPDGLRNITPYLDLCEAFGADLIRVCMKKDEDIAWARRAADEARERKFRLAHQAHTRSLFETVSGSLRVLKAIGRSNFGLIYEPANWMIAGQDYSSKTIKRLKPYLFNVYVQNCRLDRHGSATANTWSKGKVSFDHIGLWDGRGVDFADVFAGLQAIGYRGFVTVHQAFAGVMPVEQAVKKSATFLKPLTISREE